MPNKDSKKVNNNKKRGGDNGNNLCALTNEDVANFQQAVTNLNSAAAIITAIFSKCAGETNVQTTPAAPVAPVVDPNAQLAVDQAAAAQVAAAQLAAAQGQLPMPMPMPMPTPIPVPGPVSGGNRNSRKNNKNNKNKK